MYSPALAITRHSAPMNAQLTVFLTASLAVHAGLLYPTSEPNPLQLSIGGESQALSVTVAKPSQTPGQQKAFAALETTAKVRPVDRGATVRRAPAKAYNTDVPEPDALTTVTSASKTAPKKVAAVITSSTTEPVATHAHRSSALNVNEHISAALQNRLASNFEYPWLARKRGWQGQVTLSLHVDINGDLSNWQVSTTSGYRVLDRSALKAARAIQHLPEAEGLLNDQPLNLSIPVHYQLLDS